MKDFLLRLFGKKSAPNSATATPVGVLDFGQAQHPVYAIGDVHGRIDLLDALLGQIAHDARSFGSSYGIVLLGDLVDRGPSSSKVIDRVMNLTRSGDVLALMGNHERMMLDFLEDAHGNKAWLDEGGQETLASYGMYLTQSALETYTRKRVKQILEAHIPEAHFEWLKSLPQGALLRFADEQVAFCHAGYDERKSPREQSERTLLWGQGSTQGSERLRIVQGHSIVANPDTSAGRILIDTGAWSSGELTCVRLASGEPPKLLTAIIENRTSVNVV